MAPRILRLADECERIGVTMAAAHLRMIEFTTMETADAKAGISNDGLHGYGQC